MSSWFDKLNFEFGMEFKVYIYIQSVIPITTEVQSNISEVVW